jgi:4-diphosphocytidyl-2-C-methyl-D-erythritol kinase
MLKTEFAPAKLNLTLEVLGRRPDGFHEIRSLVAFAEDVGDRLTLGPGRFSATETTGPFAAEIAEGNLVDKAFAAISAAVPGFEFERLTLEKILPVASGIGGGSADAAAALRLIQRTFHAASGLNYSVISRALGADVPVCLKSRAALITGIGEHIENVALPDGLFAVLANPLVSVPQNKTARVFALLAAPPITSDRASENSPEFSTVEQVIAYAAARGNALEEPARELFPIIDTLRSELGQLAGSCFAQLSGAGPTCFALFDTKYSAEDAAAELENRHPDWWIRSTRLA